MQEITFQLYWDKNKENLKHFIRNNVREKAETEDILQETYLKGFAEYPKLREPEKFQAWIFMIARNHIRHYFRNKNKYSAQSAEDWEMISEPSFSEQAEKTLANLAEQCLAKMGNQTDILNQNITEIHQLMIAQFAGFEQIPILYLEAWVECDIKKTAQQTFATQKGISLSAAKSRVQRAREKIKNVLMNCCAFEFDVRGSVMNYTPLKADSENYVAENKCSI